MRTIEIDLDIHKLIEAERRSFSETPNEVLRRLLLLQKAQAKTSDINDTPPRDWHGKGISLPHGTELRMEYNGKRHTGEIKDGLWLVNGQTAKSPSDAASTVATTKDGKRPSLNGWIYWNAKRPNDQNWVSIESLRQ